MITYPASFIECNGIPVCPHAGNQCKTKERPKWQHWDHSKSVSRLVNSTVSQTKRVHEQYINTKRL